MQIKKVLFRIRFARVLRNYRKRSGVTAEYAAAVLGTDPPTLAAMENGQVADLDAGLVVRLIHYFAIPIGELVDPDAPTADDHKRSRSSSEVKTETV